MSDTIPIPIRIPCPQSLNSHSTIHGLPLKRPSPPPSPMKIVPTISALALALTAAQLTAAQDTTNTNFTPAEPGTAAFLKHRPVFHFLARKNWMNDPCGPYYDSETQLYHMFYQSNTEATTWGNMTWGHAVSKDQVTWDDYPNALKNEDTWDNLGVFSGFARNKAINGKDTVFYTGVTKLPISWTLPYLFGEHVNYATTSDGGKTWQKGDKPLIELPPAGMNVTGWRDPNAFDSKSLDKAFGISGESHYLITAGGIHDVGSRIFLYHSTNYLDWEYKGFLLSKEKNTTFSPYSGNWGYNFETTNYIEVTDAEGENHNVMMFAAEGTPRRYPMWAVGDISAPSSGKGICGDNDPNQGFFEPKMVGVTEYSDWYANAVFKDPKSGKEVVWGWIVEDNGYEKQPQGWNGILSVPRVVDVAIIKDVYDPENKLDAPGDWIVSSKREVGACGANAAVTAKTIKTLAFKPFEQLDLMRGDKIETVASATLSKTDSEKVLSSTGKSFELYAEVPSFEAGSKVGFKVRRSSEQDEYTSIVYDDATKKIVIDRSKSSTADCSPFVATNKPNANNTEGWFHHYSTVQGSGAQCTIKPETLKFRVYVDVSVVEVFVNDRFVISSRVYPCEGKTASDGISLMSTGAATFENVKVWTNPKKAWADDRQIKQL